jgi:tRNA pseudouridine55 synthase
LDCTGTLVSTLDVVLSREQLQMACASLGTNYIQTPPIYSAHKFEGKPLYHLARNNLLSHERMMHITAAKQKNVSLYNLKLTDFNYPYFSIRAAVSHGTYIRSLMNDIAQRAGSCATTTALTRTRIGLLSIDQALTVDILSPEAIVNTIISVASMKELLRI